jgi:formylglycine-generating enzyme required for sulfatase activity
VTALPLPEREIPLGNGISLKLILVPAGEFTIGDENGKPDEQPVHVEKISAPFWMGKFEVTNAQYACFDPEHDSRLEHGDFLQFSVEERGYPLNHPDQPVARVRWKDAAAFCEWLSALTGESFSLPTEAQWEYACRAGTTTPLWYGGMEADFAASANLADESLAHVDTYPPWNLPSGAIAPWRPAMRNINDKYRVSAPVGSFGANPWGLFDMHGNVAEWTRTSYVPCAGNAAEDGGGEEANMRKVVRGGSWYDLPERARSAARRAYHPWQPVFDVGFRVVAMDSSGLETK